MADEHQDDEVDYQRHDHATAYHNAFDQTFREKMQRIMAGLKANPGSGERKYAMQQISHLYSLALALLVPCVILLLLLTFVSYSVQENREFEVQIIEPEVVEEIDQEIEEIPDDMQEIVDIDIEIPDVLVQTDVQTDAPEISQQPVEITAVRMLKSPVVFKGIYGSRSPGARGRALKAHGAPRAADDAVMRALRWLKKTQNSDGSWPKTKVATTSMGILAFLAHGETPSSPEFGDTIRKAIEYLIKYQENRASFPKSYQHEIATYALAEAYGLTKIVGIKEAAEKAVDVLIAGQTDVGGFNYGLDPAGNNDTSVMGWAAQAFKAAKMAGLENEGLDEAIALAVKGFQANASPAGGFGYTGPGRGGLTGVGVLCMQLLGAGKLPEAQKGLVALDDVTFEWEPEGKTIKWNKLYYWYYITQAKFHAGGPRWSAWNSLFSPTLIRHQDIEKKAIEDHKGKMQDIGWWDMDEGITGHTDGLHMNTILCTLQLEVYYRYLPTFKKVEDTIDAADLSDPDTDIDIEIL